MHTWPGGSCPTKPRHSPSSPRRRSFTSLDSSSRFSARWPTRSFPSTSSARMTLPGASYPICPLRRACPRRVLRSRGRRSASQCRQQGSGKARVDGREHHFVHAPDHVGEALRKALEHEPAEFRRTLNGRLECAAIDGQRRNRRFGPGQRCDQECCNKGGQRLFRTVHIDSPVRLLFWM